MIRRPRSLDFLLVLAVAVLVSIPSRAVAHVLKQDNGISAVLHVPPDDNPTVGEPTELDIAFGDSRGVFSLTNCNCQVAVQSNGQTIQALKAMPALSGATLDSAVDTKFPDEGIYHIIVTGSATNASFKNFKLDYTLRVSGNNANPANKPSSEIVIISIGSLIILGMIGYTSISYGERYKKDKEKS